MLNLRLFVITSIFFSMSCFAMHLESESMVVAHKDVGIAEADFNRLSAYEKWEKYNALLAEHEKFQLKKSETVAKDREIKKLKDQLEQKPWKAIGITFLGTTIGLAILGKIIDSK